LEEIEMRNTTLHPLREGRLLWLFTVLLIAFTALAGHRSAEASTGNNFTMLDPAGGGVGGANDVIFTWDGTLNTDVATAVENATLSSNTPFFGQPWTAHHVMVYGPGTYTIYTGCPAGSPNCGVGTPYNITVADGQVMAHMLFDWGGNTDIDVVDIWDIASTFAPSTMFTGGGTTDPWSDDPATVWTFMSADWDGNGINGGGMIDGPFVGFNANFNVMAATGTGGGGTTNPTTPRTPGPVTIADPSFGGGCTLATRPASVAKAGDWLLVGLALVGLALFRRRAA